MHSSPALVLPLSRLRIRSGRALPKKRDALLFAATDLIGGRKIVGKFRRHFAGGCPFGAALESCYEAHAFHRFDAVAECCMEDTPFAV